MSKTTGVLIVTHNSAAWIAPCLERVRQYATKFHTFDNFSVDDSARLARSCPGGTVTESERNLGFAGGVNRGARILGTDRILVLNPDVLLETPVDALDAALDEPGVGAVAGLLVDSHGRPQTGFSVRRFPSAWTLAFEALGLNRLWPSNPVNRRYRCADVDLRNEIDVEQPAGAFVMFRREAFEELGGWDEQFHPVWFEDVDFFMRLRNAGWKVRFVPSVRATHGGGHSVGALDAASRRSYWYGSLLRYSAKHLGPLRTRFVAGAVILGVAGRLLHQKVTGQGAGQGLSGEYDTVIRLALGALQRGRIGVAVNPEVAGVAVHDVEEANKGLRTRHLHGL